MPANGNDSFGLNYVTANRFYVEMESSLRASFTECMGLTAKVKREAIFEGGVNDQQRILLGPTEFTDVTLKRGITDDLAFWRWMHQVCSPGKKTRRNVNILLFNQAGETMQCWTLIGATPVIWKAPPLKADAKSAAIEELTLAYEGLKIVARSGGGGATMLSLRSESGYFPSN